MLRSFTWTSSAIIGVESNDDNNDARLQQMRLGVLAPIRLHKVWRTEKSVYGGAHVQLLLRNISWALNKTQPKSSSAKLKSGVPIWGLTFTVWRVRTLTLLAVARITERSRWEQVGTFSNTNLYFLIFTIHKLRTFNLIRNSPLSICSS